MSSRALRRLQGRGEVMVIPPTNIEEESEEEEIVHQISNKFALLNPSDEADEEMKEDEIPEPERTEEVANDLKKRRNRKKKKRNAPAQTSNHGQENIDDVLNEIGNVPSLSASTASSAINTQTSNKSILTVEHRYLNPDNELRRIFGSRALMDDASYRRRNHGTSSKGVWLTQPQSNWAKLGKTGIAMKLIETKNGCQYFKYEHSKDYQNVQFKFLDAVESSDHQNIASVLENYNYHVDSLITFSDVYKLNDDIKMARELIERSLYCLERSFHSCFNITTGRCRLPYKFQENRSIFLALYKHMKYIAQRGCNRTALELCKVLLSLDPDDDPLCSVLLLDYFALRAAEFKFLIKFAMEWGENRNLLQLPNWAYSIALAQFNISKSEQTSTSKADESLQNALIMFPSVLLKLLEKCSVQPDVKILTKCFFTTEANDSLPQGLALLCHVFVQQNYLLWKDTAVLAWLETNVNVVMERVEKKENIVQEFAQKRKSRYQKPPLNIYRHALISELPEVSSLLPLEIRMGTLLSHDPLPPPNSVMSYERPVRSASSRVQNPVSLFFQSLLPDFNPDDPFEPPVEDGEYPDGNMGQIRGNVQTLMNAMREMLHTFQRPMNESDQEDFEQDWD